MDSTLAFGKTHVNSRRQIYLFCLSLLNEHMDIDEIRRENICALEKFSGSPTAAADKVGMSYSQYINLRDGAKDPRSGKQRAMRKETARRFEDAFGMPRGWLDAHHPSPDAATVVEEVRAAYPVTIPRHTRPLVQTLCDLADQIDDDGLREMIGYARSLTGRQPRAKAKRA